MATKLRVVSKNEQVVANREPLRAVQLVASPLPDGGSALVMLSDRGGVYVLGNMGWMAYPMMEAADDNAV